MGSTKTSDAVRKLKRRTPISDRSYVPDAPAWLGAEGKECWACTMLALMKDGNVQELDLNAIKIACATWEKWREFNDQGEDQKASNMAKLYVQIMKDFGMTPKARLKIVPHKKEDEAGADSRFLLDFDLEDK